MAQETPYILNIKGNALDDGPGVRTAIFFKGCPLRCIWCHNPESKRVENELSFEASTCIGCLQCKAVCPSGAIDEKNIQFVDREKCIKCFQCVLVCPSKSLTMVGQQWDINDIFKKIVDDKIFYDISGGGVTITGGEATMFPKFAGELLKRCKEEGIHTLLETCGQFQFDIVEQLMLPYLDAIYYDIKLFDEMQHKEYCGVSNKTILANLKRLNKYSQTHALKILVRVPLIPEITDTDDNLEQIANFLAENGIMQVALLPYNPTWYPKNAKIGLKTHEKLKNCTNFQSQKAVQEMKKIFTKKQIQVQ